MTRLGEPVPTAGSLERFIGPPLRDSFWELLAAPSAERVDAAVRYYRERFVTVGMFENRVYDGIPECLAALREAGRTLYVATSKPTVFAARILEHFGLLSEFSAVVGSELDGSRSVKGEVVAHLMARQRIPAGDAVMVGDRRHDVEGARENGLSAVAVAWGFAARGELVACRPDALVSTPAELAEVLVDCT